MVAVEDEKARSIAAARCTSERRRTALDSNPRLTIQNNDILIYRCRTTRLQYKVHQTLVPFLVIGF